jgi:ABC-2 type transport system ATP-binding protein/ribosome-dependent ATPase
MQARSQSSILAADHVTRRFGGFTAVDRVSLTVGPGEIVGLLGANGAGKTTLIRMMLGLLSSSEGVVSMFGAAPTRQMRRRLGYVSQGLGLYSDMTVAENVAFQAAAFGIAPHEIPLTEELHAMADRLVGSIGLGRQRQLAFGCALGHRPELLVLDEPTSGVDPLARARLWDVIRSEAHRDVGVLVTTHYMEEAQQCDRLVLMAAGKVAAEGTVEEIVADRTALEVRAGSWSDAFAALGDAGYDTMLVGRVVRVVSADVTGVRRALRQANVDAELNVVPAILDEAMVALSSSR